MRVMRTTIDLPDDLHRIASAIARDEGVTLSEAVSRLIRRGLFDGAPGVSSPDAETGLVFVRVGRPITSDDVRALEDE